MNRKSTILLAVLINAGLLLVLFVTALSSKDEVALVAAPASQPVHENAPAPLFGDEIDLAMRQTSGTGAGTGARPLEVSTPSAESAATSAPLHVLPPLAIAAETPVLAAPLAPSAPQSAATVTPASTSREVIVKKGDSLEKIAKAHHITVDELLKVNHLSSSFLRVGQIIKVPQGGTKSALPKVGSAVSASDYYVVKVGDNPWTIAMKNHLKVEELLKLNGLNEEKAKRLKPGDRLRVR